MLYKVLSLSLFILVDLTKSNQITSAPYARRADWGVHQLPLEIPIEFFSSLAELADREHLAVQRMQTFDMNRRQLLKSRDPLFYTSKAPTVH